MFLCRFPPHLTLKQRYGLLGNSLSVDVVAALLRYLIGDVAQQPGQLAQSPSNDAAS